MTAVPPGAAAGSSPAAAPTATASANTNIALIKYWGKADEEFADKTGRWAAAPVPTALVAIKTGEFCG